MSTPPNDFKLGLGHPYGVGQIQSGLHHREKIVHTANGNRTRTTLIAG